MIVLEHGDKVFVAVFPCPDLLCIVHDVAVDVLIAEVQVVGEFDQGILDVLPCAFFFEEDTGDFVPVTYTINTIVAIAIHIMTATTTIQIKTTTRNALRKIGSMGDNFNTVIERLIIEHNRNNLVEYGKRTVEDRENDFVNINEL